MALPDSARKHAVWWSNSPSRGRHNQAWLGTGWETTNRNLKAQTISFQRAGEPAKSQGHIATDARPRRANGATFNAAVLTETDFAADCAETTNAGWKHRVEDTLTPAGTRDSRAGPEEAAL